MSELDVGVMDGLKVAAQRIAEHPTPLRQLRAAVLVLAHYAERRGMSDEDIGQVLRDVANEFDVSEASERRLIQ